MSNRNDWMTRAKAIEGRWLRLAMLGLLTTAGASTAVAQDQHRAIVVEAFGGGATPLRHLNPEGTADFNTGFNVGGGLRADFSRYVAIRADFTFTRNEATGVESFAGSHFNRYFYGAAAELSYPATHAFDLFAFGGGGGVTVRQALQTGAATAEVPRFTKPALLLGAGARYRIPGQPLELLAEARTLGYRWDAAGFTRNQWDLTYSGGLSYRFGW